MKVTKSQVVTVVGLITSSLLLCSAASCSFEKKTPDDSTLKQAKEQLSINSLTMRLKRNKLIPIKYCRKWFFSKCIELGIPESIADFYEGRSSNSIGAKHYLSKQKLADKYYEEKLVEYFEKFNLH